MLSPTFLSTTSLSNDTRKSIASIQASLVKAQKELATGRYADVGVTLGATTGVTVSMRQDVNQITAIKATNTVVLTRMQATQSSLQTISSRTQDFLSALVGAQSSSTSPETILQQSQAGLQGVQDQLNSSLDGQYLYSGINSDVKPVEDFFANPPPASAQAVKTAFFNKFHINPTDTAASSISASDMQSFLDNEFADLFSDTNWATNWSAASDKPVTSRISRTETANTSVTANNTSFRQLTQAYAMVSGLGFANLNAAAQQVIVKQATTLVGDSMSGLTQMQSLLGVTQQRVSDTNSQIDTQVNFLNQSIDNLESVDSVQVTTELSTLTAQLEAAYNLTNRLNNLSLMNFLNSSA